MAAIKGQKEDKIFSKNTGYYCAVQSLDAIKALHDLGYVHRDIKPANFVIGLRGTVTCNTVFMVDFGIARKFLKEDGSIKTPRPKVKRLEWQYSVVIVFTHLDKVQGDCSLRTIGHTQTGRAGTQR